MEIEMKAQTETLDRIVAALEKIAAESVTAAHPQKMLVEHAQAPKSPEWDGPQDHQLRNVALTVACHGGDHEKLLERARAYYDFMKGKSAPPLTLVKPEGDNG